MSGKLFQPLPFRCSDPGTTLHSLRLRTNCHRQESSSHLPDFVVRAEAKVHPLAPEKG